MRKWEKGGGEASSPREGRKSGVTGEKKGEEESAGFEKKESIPLHSRECHLHS